MRLKNTSNCNSQEIAGIIRFVKPPGVAGFDVWVKKGREVHGRCYVKGSYHRSTAGQFRDRPKAATAHTSYVVINVPTRLGRQGKVYYHYSPIKGRGYLGVTCYTKEEALVYILAHELRHLWQLRIRKGYRVWGARGQFSERDADAYAIGALRRWRRR